MPLRYKARLLKHLSHEEYVPSAIDALATDLGVAPGEHDDFRAAVLELVRAGQVVHDNNVVILPPPGPTVVGRFKKNPKGFGFIIPSQPLAHGDLFVPAGDTLDAMTGDTVEAKVTRRRGAVEDGKNPFIASIVKVVDRKQSSFTGELRRQGGQWLVFPDGNALTEPVVVRDAESKNARAGDKVVFEVVHYPEGSMLAEGAITRVLGDAGKPDVETQAVIAAHNLPGEFPEECIEQARELGMLFAAEIEKTDSSGGFDPAVRLDLRDTFIATIDPPDAKDYDDAISIERRDHVTGGGAGFRLGIHIADVAHFVTQDSPLDLEAADRGNSVYLPRHVIPMLPEVLSNGICSLQEGVPRYCKSIFVDYDEDGRVRGMRFAQTIIKSAKRLTYLEAQALIEGDKERAKLHARTEPKYTDQLLATLKLMNTLARRIEKRRDKAGMIHLDLPQVELVYDEHGHVVDAVPEDDAYTHTLIEMFMVEANEAVARLFEKLGVPLMRRTHPDPVPGEFDSLRDFVKIAGFKIPKSPSREELQGLLKATKGTPAGPAIHFAVLRTLTRAEYSPALIGHFALASEAYAHFTSPIRRYPDLTVHRALAEYLSRTRNGQDNPETDEALRALGKKMKDSPLCPDEHTLSLIAGRCNTTEREAAEAENELRAFLVLQLLSKHIGEKFGGLVTGVTNAGVFVRLDKYLAEGLCRAEELPLPGAGNSTRRGYWQLDRRTGALVERNTGRSFSMGDRVEVVILEVDLAARRMGLLIADGATREAGKDKVLAARLNIGVQEDDFRGGLTGAQRRAQKSRSRDQGKQDFRQQKKDKGKR